MSKKGLLFFLIFCLFLLSGCEVFRIENSDPNLKVSKFQKTYKISGKAKIGSAISLITEKKSPRDKKFEFSGYLLIKNGFVNTSNICFEVKTDDKLSFSFGPRGGSKTYVASFDNKGVIDANNQKPVFGDEDKNFHLIKVVYDPAGMSLKSYVDGILFGDLNASQFLSGSKYFNYFIVNYNADGGAEVDVEYKDIKIR